jgi:hypothetical protein
VPTRNLATLLLLTIAASVVALGIGCVADESQGCCCERTRAVETISVTIPVGCCESVCGVERSQPPASQAETRSPGAAKEIGAASTVASVDAGARDGIGDSHAFVVHDTGPPRLYVRNAAFLI